jgi:hypothetical protein
MLTRSPFVLPESVKGFNAYFKFTAETSVVLQALGYRFSRQSLVLPKSTQAVGDWAEPLRARLLDALNRVAMNAEVTRREFLVAPVLLEVSRATGAELHSEFAVDVGPRLHGSLDYLLQKENALLVIEAKQADMSRGFTQLAAELIALDQFADADLPVLYGAVSVGNIWQFGTLERESKQVSQDITVYTIPTDFDTLLATLTGILLNARTEQAEQSEPGQ